jgi:GNAT superfamily N-acetyltransferase
VADEALRTRALATPLPTPPPGGWRVAVFDVSEAACVQPTDGLEDLRGLPPTEWPWTGNWYLGWFDPEDRLAAVTDVTSDMLAPDVWHVGLFIVETARHGRGDAQALYRSLERWACANGARWMRLGVVQGNARAEAFWARQGYVQMRVREGITFGAATRTVRTMIKPLVGPRDGGTVDDYLAMVVRDRPESA